MGRAGQMRRGAGTQASHSAVTTGGRTWTADTDKLPDRRTGSVAQIAAQALRNPTGRQAMRELGDELPIAS